MNQLSTATSRTKTGSPLACLGIVLNLLWIGLLTGGLYAGYVSWRLATRGTTIQGTVISLASSHDADTGTTYAPVVQYDAGGSTYIYKSSNYSDPPAYQVGQQVSLIYDSSHPDQARISNAFELWLLPAVLIGFGLGFAVPALFVLRFLGARRTR